MRNFIVTSLFLFLGSSAYAICDADELKETLAHELRLVSRGPLLVESKPPLMGPEVTALLPTKLLRKFSSERNRLDQNPIRYLTKLNVDDVIYFLDTYFRSKKLANHPVSLRPYADLLIKLKNKRTTKNKVANRLREWGVFEDSEFFKRIEKIKNARRAKLEFAEKVANQYPSNIVNFLGNFFIPGRTFKKKYTGEVVPFSVLIDVELDCCLIIMNSQKSRVLKPKDDSLIQLITNSEANPQRKEVLIFAPNLSPAKALTQQEILGELAPDSVGQAFIINTEEDLLRYLDYKLK